MSLRNSRAAVERAFQLEDPRQLIVENEDIEAQVLADIGSVPFGGRLDRRTRQPILRISDYKSGKRPSPQYLGSKLRQLYLYAAADHANGLPVQEVELLFLGGEGVRVRRPVYSAALEDAVGTLVAMREQSTAALDAMMFTARRSPLCGYCAFKKVCPVFAARAPAPGSTAFTGKLEAMGIQRRTPRTLPLSAVSALATDSEPFETALDVAEEAP